MERSREMRAEIGHLMPAHLRFVDYLPGTENGLKTTCHEERSMTETM